MRAGRRATGDFLIHQLIDPLLGWVRDTIAGWGYPGIIVMMAIESANIPLPSEAIMPAAGILVQQQQINLHLAALAGAFGCLVGSIPSYLLGLCGGRPFLQRHGRWLLLSNRDLVLAEAWVQKYGNGAFFICRMLPIVRTFISFPAGVLRAPFPVFCLLTFLGSLIWCYFLAYMGIKFAENLEFFVRIWHEFDLVIVLCISIGFIYYLYHHLVRR